MPNLTSPPCMKITLLLSILREIWRCKMMDFQHHDVGGHDVLKKYHCKQRLYCYINPRYHHHPALDFLYTLGQYRMLYRHPLITIPFPFFVYNHFPNFSRSERKKLVDFFFVYSCFFCIRGRSKRGGFTKC